MRIDESLARGLARQLIKDWIAKTEYIYTNAIKTVRNSNMASKKGFEKYLKHHKKLFEPLCFSYVETGSQKHPITGFVFAIPYTDRKYNDWTEKGVRGVVDFELKDANLFSEQLRETIYSPFFIGEHVITRIIQRSFTQANVKNITPENIVKKFNYVPMWSAFWIMLFFQLISKNEFTSDEIDSLSPIIPTEDGLLICKMINFNKDVDVRFVEIRTYINYLQFDEEQKEIHEFLMEISKNLSNSSLSLFPYTEFNKEFFLDFIIIHKVLMKRLEKNVELIAKQLGRNKKDNFTYFKLAKIIKDISINLKFSKESFNKFDRILSEKSTRDYHSIIKQILFNALLNSDQALNIEEFSHRL